MLEKWWKILYDKFIPFFDIINWTTVSLTFTIVKSDSTLSFKPWHVSMAFELYPTNVIKICENDFAPYQSFGEYKLRWHANIKELGNVPMDLSNKFNDTCMTTHKCESL